MPSSPPRMIARSPRRVELTLPNKPTVSSYTVQAHATLDGAFAGATTMFSVPRGGDYRSPGLRRQGLGLSDSNFRNLTHVLYDPDEFFPLAPASLPPDANQGYIRVVETNLAGVALPASPILVMPHPGLFATPRPSMTLAGTAPNVAALATLLPPPGAMHFIFPRFSDNLTIRNTGGASLFVSFSAGQPEYEVLNGEAETFWEGAMSEIFIRGDGATVTFTIFAALVNGEMA